MFIWHLFESQKDIFWIPKKKNLAFEYKSKKNKHINFCEWRDKNKLIFPLTLNFLQMKEWRVMHLRDFNKIYYRSWKDQMYLFPLKSSHNKMLFKPLQNENVQIDKTKCATHEIPKFKLCSIDVWEKSYNRNTARCKNNTSTSTKLRKREWMKVNYDTRIKFCLNSSNVSTCCHRKKTCILILMTYLPGARLCRWYDKT